MSFFLDILSMIVGIQFVFWGFNGYFNWFPPPPSSERFEAFVKACYEVQFIMPTVKAFEVIGGFFLIIPMTQELGLQLLAPIVFVITGLQLFHHPKPWIILSTLCFPFWALFLFMQAAF